MKFFVQIIFLFFPWRVRRFVLNRLFNFNIANDAYIGKSIILCDELIMKSNSFIGSFTFCKAIKKLHMHERARIGTLNWITGFPENDQSYFSHRINRKCEFIIKRHSAVTSRHFLDCTSGIYIGEYTTFAGVRSQILTHSINVRENIQDCLPVEIGDFCFVGTNVVILPGSILPNYSVLGAKSLLNKKFVKPSVLYGGIPAKEIQSLKIDETKYFTRKIGVVK